jgi:amino acid transporter
MMATQASVTPAKTLERRAVGLPTAIGTTFGLIVASTVLASVAAGFFASWVFLVALAIGLITMYLQSMSFAELATMIPKAGSMNEYVRPALGPFFASVTVLVGYISVQLFPTAAESFTPSIVVHDFLGATFISIRGWVIVFVVFVALVNAAGIRPYASVEVLLTVSVSLSLLVFGIIGITGSGTGHVISGPFPHITLTWDLLWPLLGIAVFTFVGMEYTCPLAEEMRDPGRDIPLGIFLGLTLTAVGIILFGLAGARYVPASKLSAFSPVAHMDVAVAVLGNAGKWWMAFIGIGATLSTLNALLAGIPRILYGMALTRQLPPIFAYLLPRTRAPVVGIAVVALMPILMNLFINLATASHFVELILAGVLGWATAYVIIHFSVIILRIRYPQRARPFRSPLFPLPQLLGTALLVLAALRIFSVPSVRDHIYRDWGIFLGCAVVLALLYNAYAYRSLTTQFKPVPLDDVYRETEAIEADLPLPVEPAPESLGSERAGPGPNTPLG